MAYEEKPSEAPKKIREIPLEDVTEGNFAEFLGIEEKNRDVITKIIGEKYSLPPIVPGSKELIDLHVQCQKQMTDFYKGAASFLENGKNQKEIAGILKANLQDRARKLLESLSSYNSLHVTTANGTGKELQTLFEVTPDNQATFQALVLGKSSILPPPVQKQIEKKKADALAVDYQRLSAQETQLRTKIFLFAQQKEKITKGDKESFSQQLSEHRKACEEYERESNAVIVPIFRKKLLAASSKEAQKDGSELLTDDGLLNVIEDLRRAVPLPKPAEETSPEIRDYLGKTHTRLVNIQSQLVSTKADDSDEGGLIDKILEALRHGKDIKDEQKSLERLMGNITIYLHELYEYEVLLGRKPPNQNGKFLKFLALAVSIDFVNRLSKHQPAPKAPRLTDFERAEIKEAYKKVARQLAAKGVMPPKLRELMAVMDSGPYGPIKEFGKSLYIHSPVDFILFAIILNSHENKLRAFMEFTSMMAIGGMSSAVLSAAQYALYRIALTSESRLALFLARVPGNPYVKFAAVVVACFVAHDKLNKWMESLDEAIPEGGFKDTLNDVLHFASLGPVSDLVSLLDMKSGGLEVGRAGDDMKFLSKKAVAFERGLARHLNFHQDHWNKNIDTRIGETSSSIMKKFYELEKIDLPSHTMKENDPEGWKREWMKSGWVKRQALDTFMSIVDLRRQEEAFYAKAKNARINGPFPSITDFLIQDDDVAVRHLPSETLDEVLKKKFDSNDQFGQLQSAVSAKNNKNLSDEWKLLKKSAMQIGLNISVYRELGVYDPEVWFGNKKDRGENKRPEFVSEGIFERVTFLMKRRQALAYDESLTPRAHANELVDNINPIEDLNFKRFMFKLINISSHLSGFQERLADAWVSGKEDGIGTSRADRASQYFHKMQSAMRQGVHTLISYFERNKLSKAEMDEFDRLLRPLSDLVLEFRTNGKPTLDALQMAHAGIHDSLKLIEVKKTGFDKAGNTLRRRLELSESNTVLTAGEVSLDHMEIIKLLPRLMSEKEKIQKSFLTTIRMSPPPSARVLWITTFDFSSVPSDWSVTTKVFQTTVGAGRGEEGSVQTEDKTIPYREWVKRNATEARSLGPYLAEYERKAVEFRQEQQEKQLKQAEKEKEIAEQRKRLIAGGIVDVYAGAASGMQQPDVQYVPGAKQDEQPYRMRVGDRKVSVEQGHYHGQRKSLPGALVIGLPPTDSQRWYRLGGDSGKEDTSGVEQPVERLKPRTSAHEDSDAFAVFLGEEKRGEPQQSLKAVSWKDVLNAKDDDKKILLEVLHTPSYNKDGKADLISLYRMVRLFPRYVSVDNVLEYSGKQDLIDRLIPLYEKENCKRVFLETLWALLIAMTKGDSDHDHLNKKTCAEIEEKMKEAMATFHREHKPDYRVDVHPYRDAMHWKLEKMRERLRKLEQESIAALLDAGKPPKGLKAKIDGAIDDIQERQKKTQQKIASIDAACAKMQKKVTDSASPIPSPVDLIEECLILQQQMDDIENRNENALTITNRAAITLAGGSRHPDLDIEYEKKWYGDIGHPVLTFISHDLRSKDSFAAKYLDRLARFPYELAITKGSDGKAVAPLSDLISVYFATANTNELIVTCLYGSEAGRVTFHKALRYVPETGELLEGGIKKVVQNELSPPPALVEPQQLKKESQEQIDLLKKGPVLSGEKRELADAVERAAGLTDKEKPKQWRDIERTDKRTIIGTVQGDTFVALKIEDGKMTFLTHAWPGESVISATAKKTEQEIASKINTPSSWQSVPDVLKGKGKRADASLLLSVLAMPQEREDTGISSVRRICMAFGMNPENLQDPIVASGEAKYLKLPELVVNQNPYHRYGSEYGRRIMLYMQQTGNAKGSDSLKYDVAAETVAAQQRFLQQLVKDWSSSGAAGSGDAISSFREREARGGLNVSFNAERQGLMIVPGGSRRLFVHPYDRVTVNTVDATRPATEEYKVVKVGDLMVVRKKEDSFQTYDSLTFEVPPGKSGTWQVKINDEQPITLHAREPISVTGKDKDKPLYPGDKRTFKIQRLPTDLVLASDESEITAKPRTVNGLTVSLDPSTDTLTVEATNELKKGYGWITVGGQTFSLDVGEVKANGLQPEYHALDNGSVMLEPRPAKVELEHAGKKSIINLDGETFIEGFGVIEAVPDEQKGVKLMMIFDKRSKGPFDLLVNGKSNKSSIKEYVPQKEKPLESTSSIKGPRYALVRNRGQENESAEDTAGVPEKIYGGERLFLNPTDAKLEIKIGDRPFKEYGVHSFETSLDTVHMYRGFENISIDAVEKTPASGLPLIIRINGKEYKTVLYPARD